MPQALIARCVQEACARRISCAHFREVETDPSLPEIPAPKQNGEGCREYIQIGFRAGKKLKPWGPPSDQSARPAAKSPGRYGDDPFAKRFGPRRG